MFKPYFAKFYHYLFTHPSIKNLSVFEREVEILLFINEHKNTISVFVEKEFEREVQDFSNFIREKNNTILEPYIKNTIAEIEFNLLEPILGKEINSESISFIFDEIKNYPILREEFLFDWNCINSGYILFYISRLFEMKNSYILHLIKREEPRVSSARILKNYLKVLLLVRIIAVKFCIENKIKERHNLKSLAQICADSSILNKEIAEILLESYLTSEDEKKNSVIASLIAIFSSRIKIPRENSRKRGVLGFDESWFSTKQFSSKNFDFRVLKELNDIAKVYKR